MSEQKHEPKVKEHWLVCRPEIDNKPIIAEYVGDDLWHVYGDEFLAISIAPVVSHEIVAEIVEALSHIEYLDRPQVRGLPRRTSIHDIATLVLAKARAAGLGENND